MTARKLRLEQRTEAGDKCARAALAMAHDPAAFFSAVQVGITRIGDSALPLEGLVQGQDPWRDGALYPELD